MTFPLKPLADRLIIEQEEAPEKIEGTSLYLSDYSKERPANGIVKAVGAGKFDDFGNRQPMNMVAGDKVLFSKYSGTGIKLEGIEYLILEERDVLAIFPRGVNE